MCADSTKISAYIAKHIGEFHRSRIDSLKKLDLDAVLKREKPNHGR